MVLNRISISLVLQLQEYKSLTLFIRIFLNNIDGITFFTLTYILYTRVFAHMYGHTHTKALVSPGAGVGGEGGYHNNKWKEKQHLCSLGKNTFDFSHAKSTSVSS